MWKLFLSRRSRGLSTGFDGVSGTFFPCRESTNPFGTGGGLAGIGGSFGGSVEDVAAAAAADDACGAA
eukprot:4985062-Amphidinium_carterae.1